MNKKQKGTSRIRDSPQVPLGKVTFSEKTMLFKNRHEYLVKTMTTRIA